MAATRDQKRMKVVLGAIDLIAEKPFASVTIEELAQRSGISFWSTYRHQPKREQILRMAIGHLASRIVQSIAPAQHIQDSVHQTVLSYTSHVAALMKGDDYFRLLSIIIREGRDAAWLTDYYENVSAALVRGLEDVIHLSGARYGALILLQDDATRRRFLMRLESATVMPRLHPSPSWFDDHDTERTIKLVANEVIAATYACDREVPNVA